MAASNADIGYLSTFGIGATTAGPFTTVAEVVTITPPAMQREAIDVTHLESDDQYKEFIAGFKEGGPASIGLNFVPSETDVLVSAFETGSGGYEITFPNGVTMTFAGIVTAYEIGELSNDKMSATFTVQCSGKPTLAAAS